MICPRCRKTLTEVEVGAQQAWVCQSCDGALIGDLEALLSLSEEQLRSSPLLECLFSDHPQQNLLPEIWCPTCQEKMNREFYAQTSQVEVDRCPAGHGVWLDDGELARIYDFVHPPR